LDRWQWLVALHGREHLAPPWHHEFLQSLGPEYVDRLIDLDLRSP
jgi:hypothetical protein